MAAVQRSPCRHPRHPLQPTRAEPANVRRVKAGVSIEELPRTSLVAASPVLCMSAPSSTRMARKPASTRCPPAVAAIAHSNALRRKSASRRPCRALHRWRRRRRHPHRRGLRSPKTRTATPAPARPVPRVPGHERQGPDRRRHRGAASSSPQRRGSACASPPSRPGCSTSTPTRHDTRNVMAFTLTTDHARQEQVWEAVRTAGHEAALSDPPHADRNRRARRRQPRRIRRHRAYEAAGGEFPRSFQSDAAAGFRTWLLDRLVAEKLEAAADEMPAMEGWKWVRGRAQSALWRDPRIAGACRDDGRHHRAGTGRTGCPTGRIQPPVRGI